MQDDRMNRGQIVEDLRRTSRQWAHLYYEAERRIWNVKGYLIYSVALNVLLVGTAVLVLLSKHFL